MSVQTKTITKTLYVTSDGTEFENEDAAQQHQAAIDRRIKVYLVRYSPDLTEGRGMQRSGLIKVAAEECHKMFADFAASELFGNPIAFVQGVFGNNAIVHNWTIRELNNDAVRDNFNTPVIATVQDKWCEPHYFPPGLTDLRTKK